MAWSAAQVIGSSAGTQIVQTTGFFNLWLIIAAMSFTGAAGYHYLYKQNNNKNLSPT